MARMMLSLVGNVFEQYCFHERMFNTSMGVYPERENLPGEDWTMLKECNYG